MSGSPALSVAWRALAPGFGTRRLHTQRDGRLSGIAATRAAAGGGEVDQAVGVGLQSVAMTQYTTSRWALSSGAGSALLRHRNANSFNPSQSSVASIEHSED